MPFESRGIGSPQSVYSSYRLFPVSISTVLCEQNDLLAEFAYQCQPMTDAQLKMFNNDKYRSIGLGFVFSVY